MKFSSLLLGALVNVNQAVTISQARDNIDIYDTPSKKDLMKIAAPKFEYPDPYALGTTTKAGGGQPKKNVVVKPVVSFAPGKPQYIPSPYSVPYPYAYGIPADA